MQSGGGLLIMGTATLTNTNLYSNVANCDGGGGLSIWGMASTATLTNTNVYSNEAVYEGGGLHIAGTATLTNTHVHDNLASLGGSNLYLAGVTTYMLPAPPGYWVPATKCEVWRKPCPQDEAKPP